MPIIMRIGRWFAALFAAGAFVSILIALAGIGSFRMGGMPVSRAAWLHIAAPLVALIGCLMASVSYGFASRRSWSRHVVMSIWAVIVVYAISTGAMKLVPRIIMWRAIVQASVFACVSVWYFYAKRNVVAYFRSLRERPFGATSQL